MEQPESSLPYSQAPATCPYPEPTPSSPHNSFPLAEDPSYYYPPNLRLGLPNCLFPSGFPTKIYTNKITTLNVEQFDRINPLVLRNIHW